MFASTEAGRSFELQVLTGLALGGLGATCGAIVYFLHIEEVRYHSHRSRR